MASLHAYEFHQAGALPEEMGWQRPFTPMAARAHSNAQLRLQLAPDGDDPTGYGRKLAELLHAIPVDAAESARDLLIIGEPRRSWQERWFGSAATRRVVAPTAVSTLLVRQPRWPLRHLLVILRGQPEDETAVTWALRLAKAAGASLSLLPVIPDQPGYYSQGDQVQPPLTLLLMADSLTGRCLRRQLGRVQETAVTAEIVSHNGPPAEQIAREIHASDPDLILIGAESCGRFLRLWLGEIVTPLLRCADRPILIARS